MSIISMQVGQRTFNVDSNKGYDLSIPYRFKRESLTAFGFSPATLQTVENKYFVGDTRQNGSCNVEQYTLIPHCHGTHTECVGHIVDEEITIVDILKEVWIPALILTVKLERGRVCSDRYVSGIADNDQIISKEQLSRCLDKFSDQNFLQALIIRTLPNDTSKTTRHYSYAPYFSNEAMEIIANQPIQHLLVDIPSVDCMDDQGKLSNHRLFWGLKAGRHHLGQQIASSKTITELIFVADDIKDGYYLLNLQISPFKADAAPSRPIVFPELVL